MVEVDSEEGRHCVIVFDGVGIRTVVKMPHEDGVDLLRQLQEYYGRIQYGRTGEQPTKAGLLGWLKNVFLGGRHDGE